MVRRLRRKPPGPHQRTDPLGLRTPDFLQRARLHLESPDADALAAKVPGFNWALVAIFAATVFYVRLSPRLSAGLLFFMAMGYCTIVAIELSDVFPVWKICAVLFVLAWIGQFIGHQIEGKKPAFLKDLVFLLIGPAWLMSFVYKKLGQRY